MMRNDSDSPSSAMYMLGGFAIGMLVMYMLDPVQGNRRRALVRDKMYSTAVTARKQAAMKSRDLANRAQGMTAEIRHAVDTVKDARPAQ